MVAQFIIDWLPIRAAYIADPKLTLNQLAKKFGVSATACKKRSTKDGWINDRQKIAQRAEEAINKKLVAQKVMDIDAFNYADYQFAQIIRGEALEEMARLKESNQLDSRKLLELINAQEKAQKVGRLAMGLSTNSNELTGKGGEALNAAPPIINVNFTDAPGAESSE